MDSTELKAHAKRIGITVGTLRNRINKWGEEKALTTPRMNHSVAGRKGRAVAAANDKYRFMLPGSHTFDGL